MSELTDQITAEFERERKTPRKAIHPDDIPSTYDSITPEWLTHILCKGHPEAKVVSCRLDAPDEGGTNRRRIFIDYNAAGKAAALPPSVFCKASQELVNRLILAASGFIRGEVTFYRDYRHLVELEAPHCLLATYSPVSYNSIVVLDDLARSGATFCEHWTDITRQRIESQLTLMANLHARFYESAELRKSTLPRFDEYFRNFDEFMGMEKFCNDGFLAAEEFVPKRLFARFAETWPATVKSVALHHQLPLTFTHNDPHLRNWYIAADGSMGLADWQNFGGGHWGRDVAYTISSSLTRDNRRAWEKDLLQFYLDRFAAAGGPSVAYDEAFKYYRQHMFSTLAWWTSTLIVATTQPRDATLEIIGRITTAIDDLDALESFK